MKIDKSALAFGPKKHKRMKRRQTGATATEQRHLDRVRAMGCLICKRPAIPHHLMHVLGKERRRDHRFVIPLCDDHHRGVHGIGHDNADARMCEEAYLEHHGISPVAWATSAWIRSIEVQAAA